MNDDHITGLILAGGRGSRISGADKGWIKLDSKYLIELVLDKLAPQVDDIIISANRNLDDYRKLGYPVYTDENNEFQGPLAGILSGLKNAQSEYVLTVACDSPFFPENLAARLLEKAIKRNADIVSVSDCERIHPVFALIKTSLISSLHSYLQSGGRKIDKWYAMHRYEIVEFTNEVEKFANINTKEDLLKFRSPN